LARNKEQLRDDQGEKGQLLEKSHCGYGEGSNMLRVTKLSVTVTLSIHTIWHFPYPELKKLEREEEREKEGWKEGKEGRKERKKEKKKEEKNTLILPSPILVCQPKVFLVT
jgi:hypothetical protein